MATPSTLRTVSRVLGSLTLIAAMARVAMAVSKGAPIPWVIVLCAVAVCALVWLLPPSLGQRA
jgi:hypothetical protein